MLNYSSVGYLPSTLSRIIRLRRLVNGRPVVILAAGSSIKKLETNIEKLKDKDICYFGLNTFSVQENHILKKINKKFSVVLCSSREGIVDEIENIKSFLDRKENNIFISSFWRNTFELMPKNFNISVFLDKYDPKLLFFSLDFNRMIPSNNKPFHFTVSNSLLALIQIAIIGKASSITLFGADGYNSEGKDQYYCPGEYHTSLRQNLIRDTYKYFNPIALNAIENLNKTYNLPNIQILNCSPKSFYTPFPTVSYLNTIKILRGEKKYKPTMDCRIPVVSVITREKHDKLVLQSYTNFEQINIGQKSSFFQKCLIRGLSKTKGKYIIYFPRGNEYVNRNWINLCVETLDNNPDISLVWGLSQQISSDLTLGKIDNNDLLKKPPFTGKQYFFTWLERKIVFPESNFCVRKEIFYKCLFFQSMKIKNEDEFWIKFSYHFNVLRYISYFVPFVVNYRVALKDNHLKQQLLIKYNKKINDFYTRNKKKILKERIIYLCYNLAKWSTNLKFRL